MYCVNIYISHNKTTKKVIGDKCQTFHYRLECTLILAFNMNTIFITDNEVNLHFPDY